MLASILINNFNYDRFLAECIKSAIDQKYKHKEIIVVDDGSTDRSRQVIDQFAGQISCVLKSNGGQASAFNAGFMESSGDIILFLDADDTFRPNKLDALMDAYEKHPEIGWCHDVVTSLDPNHYLGKPGTITVLNHRRQMTRPRYPHIPSPTSTLSFRREVLSQILPMPTAADVVLSDNYLKFAAAYLSPGAVLNQPLTVQRIHGNNRYTGRKDRSRIRSDIMIATGAQLAKRYPELRSFGMGLTASGIALSPDLAETLRRFMKSDHLEFADSTVSRVKLLGLVARKYVSAVVRRRMRGDRYS